MGNAEIRPSRVQGMAKRATEVGLGAAALTLGAPAVASAFEGQPQAIVSEGVMPSQDLMTAGALQISMPMESSSNTVELIKFHTPEQAAARYGYDAYSKDPSHWKINSYGGSELVPDPTGKAHRVKVGGANWDGWLKVYRPGIDSVDLVINWRTSYADIQGGTAWLETNPEAGFAKLLAQLKAKEKTEQPGTKVMPICTPLKVETRTVGIAKLSAASAAKRFGRDSYSENPANWRVNQYGAPELLPDVKTGQAHLIDATGVVVDGWLKIDRVSGFDALPFVASPQGPNPFTEMDVQGGTIWIPQTSADRNALHWQVLRQQKAREKVEQPGTLVTSICN